MPTPPPSSSVPVKPPAQTPSFLAGSKSGRVRMGLLLGVLFVIMLVLGGWFLSLGFLMAMGFAFQELKSLLKSQGVFVSPTIYYSSLLCFVLLAHAHNKLGWMWAVMVWSVPMTFIALPALWCRRKTSSRREISLPRWLISAAL